MADTSAFWHRLVIAFENANPSEIAEKLSFSRAGLYKWRSGESLPDGQTLLAISKTTGVSLHWLLTGEGEMRVGQTLILKPSIEELIQEIARRVAKEEIENALSHSQVKPNLTEAREVKGSVRVPSLILKEEKRKTG